MSTILRTATELSAPSPLPRVTPLVYPATAARNPEERKVGQYLLIAGQLALLIALSYRFDLEGESFRQLFVLTAGGFAIHYFLPFEQRLRSSCCSRWPASPSCSARARARGWSPSAWR